MQWLEHRKKNRCVVMASEGGEQCSTQRDRLIELRPQTRETSGIEDELHELHAISCIVVLCGNGTHCRAEFEIKADLLRIVLRVFAESGCSVEHAANELAGDGNCVGLVP